MGLKAVAIVLFCCKLDQLISLSFEATREPTLETSDYVCPTQTFIFCRNKFFSKIGLSQTPVDATMLLEHTDRILSDPHIDGYHTMCRHYEELHDCIGPAESICLEFKNLLDSGLKPSVAQVFRGAILALHLECGNYATTRSIADSTATTVEPALKNNSSVTDPSSAIADVLGSGCEMDGNLDIFGGLFCTNAYVSCTNGTRGLETCLTGLKFDNYTRSCIEPKLITACQDDHLVVDVELTNLVFFDGNCTDWNSKLHSDPAKLCSDVYYVCLDGLPHKVTCPPEMIFDDTKSACLPFEQVAICIRDATQLPTTTDVHPHPDFNCESMADGNYQNPLHNCSHLFYSCSGGSLEVQKCPGETKFDAEVNSCQFHQFVVACGGVRILSTSTDTHSTTESPFSCLDKLEQNYADPLEPCSRVFYTCVGGDTVERVCPGGTRYDVRVDSCQFARSVPACNGGADVPLMSTTISSSSALRSTSAPYHFDCTMKKDGNYRDSRKPCSSDFFSCVSGDGLIQHCPGHLRYDAVTDSCQFATHVIDCGGKPPLPQSSTVAVTTKKPLFSFDCGDKDLGNYPNPSVECSQVFFTCAGENLASIRQCPGDTYYDDEMDMCLYYSQVPKCVGTPRVTIGTTPVPTEKHLDEKTTAKLDILVVETNNRQPIVVLKPEEKSLTTSTASTVQTTSTEPTSTASATVAVAQDQPDNSTSEVPAINHFVCSAGSDKVYPPPGRTCVSHFYQCHEGVINRVECPMGRKYSRSLDACLSAIHIPECSSTLSVVLSTSAHP